MTMQRLLVAVPLLMFIVTAVWAQTKETPPVEETTPPVGETNPTGTTSIPEDGGFLKPESQEFVDVFTYKDMEYLVVNMPMRFINAHGLCASNYNGKLAHLKDVTVADFMAEALSETKVEMDTIWVGGVNKSVENVQAWYWETKEFPKYSYEKIAQEILDLIVVNNGIQTEDRMCLGFGRENHDLPHFRPTACNGERGFLCERARGAEGGKNSSHVGWIHLVNKWYKIFAGPADYHNAYGSCVEMGNNITFAEVDSYHIAQELGRHLLIGRPSLENAWIGISWETSRNKYVSEMTGLELESTTNETTRYPPWRGGTMKKPGGCILLDRHLANTTLFVEARCERLRAFICCKPDYNISESDDSISIILPPHGYRLQFGKRIWTSARDFCKTTYEKYNSKLVEPDDAAHVKNLLYVMGENKTAVQHIWVGAKHDTDIFPAQWKWDSTNTPITPDQLKVLRILKNETYTHEVEKNNLCLNMDRENHLVAIYYGTICKFEQAYVCQFKDKDLQQLLDDEKAVEPE